MSRPTSLRTVILMICALAAAGVVALAQSAGPQPSPMPSPIAAPRDIPYPGTLVLNVDATDIAHRIFRVHETIPVSGGEPIVLLYPAWLPGYHGPVGSVDKLSGLEIHAGGNRIEWTRDTVDVFAFHVNVPPGVSSIVADFQFDSSVEGNEGRIVMTPEMESIEWSSLALYPAGYFARQIPVAASVKLPDGWQFGTALEWVATTVSGTNDSLMFFKPVSLDTLAGFADMVAGRYFRTHRPGSRRSGAGSHGCRCGSRRAARSQARSDRRTPRTGAAGL